MRTIDEMMEVYQDSFNELKKLMKDYDSFPEVTGRSIKEYPEEKIQKFNKLYLALETCCDTLEETLQK